MKAGRPVGLGQIELSADEWARISKRYRGKEGFGLGDLIAWLLKPFVRAADKALGAKLQNCHPCRARRERLNRVRIG